MPICPKDVLQGRGRLQDVYPWQRVTTKIKYHPFSLAAGAWVCTSLSSSKQTTWPGKSGVLPSGLWGGLLNYRDLCVLSVPKLVSRPELAELCRSLGQLQQEGPPHTHTLFLTVLVSEPCRLRQGPILVCHLALNAMPGQRLGNGHSGFQVQCGQEPPHFGKIPRLPQLPYPIL